MGRARGWEDREQQARTRRDDVIRHGKAARAEVVLWHRRLCEHGQRVVLVIIRLARNADRAEGVLLQRSGGSNSEEDCEGTHDGGVCTTVGPTKDAVMARKQSTVSSRQVWTLLNIDVVSW